jgi:phosphate-selective porin
MGLENIVSSRSLTLMEESAPVQALAPGFRSGIAAAGHSAAWRFAWKAGFYSVGQAQISGDASNTSAQFVGRIAGLPWRHPSDLDTFLHLGLSASYVISGDNVRYRARPESFIAPFTVDTHDIPARHAFQSAVEAAWVDGPLLVSAEALQSSVAVEGGGNPNFYGFYVLLGLVLTGESHPYDTSTGMFARLEPRRPFSVFGAERVGGRSRSGNGCLGST